MSSAVLPNRQACDKIIERLQDEKDAQESSVKQIVEDRKIRNLAKQSTWKSVTSHMQRQISQKSLDGEPITEK